MPQTANPKSTFSFISLGCPKNLVDSERMLGLLGQEGYAIQSEPAGSDFVVVNTCGFIDPARQESLAVIREMAELKRQGKIGGIIVSGCLAERNREALLDEVPEIDQLVGVFGREDIAKVADRFLHRLEEQRSLFRPAPVHAWDDRARLRITPRHYAYLKISEGCDRLCTFCAIPQMRGKHVSKPIELILAEAEELASDGVRELNIVAQDTTYYGQDLYGQPRLADLLRSLEGIAGIDWIRLLYCYPIGFSRELVEVLASSAKIVPYIDLPLQHINDVMLRRMQRRVNRRQTEELIDRLRQAIPDLVMRTTFIVGFPGETEVQFRELEQFVTQARFERVGVFEYSFEPTTPSARLPDHVPQQVKQERRGRLMQAQQQVAFEWNASQVGRRLDALIDQPVAGQDDLCLARSYMEAPEVDSVIFVSGDQLARGQLVPIEIVGFDDYDLIGTPIRSGHDHM